MNIKKLIPFSLLFAMLVACNGAKTSSEQSSEQQVTTSEQAQSSEVEQSSEQQSSEQQSSEVEQSSEQQSSEQQSSEQSSEPEPDPEPEVITKIYRFEAENAVITGSPSQEGNEWIEEAASASGGKSIGSLSVTGNTVTWTFSAEEAGTGVITFYMSATTMDSSWNIGPDTINTSVFDVTVNGGDPLEFEEQTLPSQGSSSWNNSFDPIEMPECSFVAGENTVKISVKGDACPNIDCMDIETAIVLVGGTEVEKTEKATDHGATLNYNVGGYEFGPAVDTAIIHFAGAVSSVSKDMFAVRNNNTSIEVLDAYLSDAKGLVVNATSSEYVSLKLAYTYSGYSATITPFSYNYTTSKNAWVENLSLEVSLASGQSITAGEEEITSFKVGGSLDSTHRIVNCTADLNKGSYTYGSGDDAQTLQYAAYETADMKTDSGKNPLIIWLHGAGEGGTDVDIALLGNDVTNLMENDIQKYFIDDSNKGAYVLAVQTPTFWMDNGDGKNHSGDEDSVWTEALKACIDKYVADNGDIDSSRIYLGGCSNGGYMTMNMLINYPSYFAAAYPICEAYADSFIDETKLGKLKDQHIWFTAAANDTTVAPANFTAATYARLNAAGASDVHFSYFETVLGQDVEGQSYMGHWSWIYTLQDRCTMSQAAVTSAADLVASNAGGGATEVKVGDSAVTLWGWLAAQQLGA